MENDNQKNGFSYTYSALQQAEIRRIREKYTPKAEEDKMARLRRLDTGVTRTAQIASLIFGVLGVLTLGFGMSLIMTDLAAHLALKGNTAMVIGIVIGVIGGILASLAYPVYSVILKAKRKKLSPEIMYLIDELTK